MELLDAIKQRRSIRHYLPQAVEREKLLDLVAAAQKAPVSCNLQLLHYVILDQSDILEQLTHRVSHKFGYAPAAILVLHDPRFTVERDSGVTAMGAAVENILLRAVDLGLGTCAMAGFHHDAIIREILHIPHEWNIGLLISIGYPDPTFHQQTIAKLPLEQIYSFNQVASAPTINSASQLARHTPASIRDYRARIGSVYLDRFRLNTWSDQLYRRTSEIFQQSLKSLLPSSFRLLDLMTYDAKFLQLIRPTLDTTTSVIATDYVLEHLQVYRSLLNCETVLIDEHNQLPASTTPVDVVTCIFQSTFTPAFESLLVSGVKNLKSGGYLYLVHGQESFNKRLIRFGRRLQRQLSGLPVNIYEGNPYFRIGPYQHRTVSEIRKNLQSLGLQIKVEQSWTKQDVRCTAFIAQLPIDATSTKKR